MQESRGFTNAGIGVVVAALVALSSGPLYRVRTWWGYDDPLSTDVTVVAIHALFGIGAAIWMATGARWRLAEPMSAAIAVGWCAWLLLGTAWSTDPVETARQALQITSAMVVGAAAVVALGWRTFRWAAWAALHLGLGWSAVAVYLDRSGTIDAQGDWAGVYFNRNSLALYAAFGLLFGLTLLAGTRRPLSGARSWAQLGVVGLFVVVDVRLIAGSDALTPLVALTAAVAFGAVFVLAARRISASAGSVQVAVTVIGIVAVGGVAVAWVTRSSWLDRLGRRSNLTGRSEVWDLAIERALDRTLHGYGYMASWQDERFSAAVEEVRGSLLGSAHNSFIEMFLGAGLVGLALFVALVVQLYRRTAAEALSSRVVIAVAPVVLLAFVVVENLSETLIIGNQFTVAVLGSLVVASRESSTLDQRPVPPDERTGVLGGRT